MSEANLRRNVRISQPVDVKWFMEILRMLRMFPPLLAQNACPATRFQQQSSYFPLFRIFRHFLWTFSPEVSINIVWGRCEIPETTLRCLWLTKPPQRSISGAVWHNLLCSCGISIIFDLEQCETKCRNYSRGNKQPKCSVWLRKPLQSGQ